MTQFLTKWTNIFISISLLFFVSPISFYGYYTDTFFRIVTIVLICFVVGQRLKNKLSKLVTSLFVFCALIIVYTVYKDLDFTFWGFVKQGTVKSIKEENQKSNFIVKTVYYQKNDNEKIGPSECLYWEKASIKYFPIFEWTLNKCINCCGEIEELK